MLHLKRWLTPPTFPGDDVKTRRASVLNAALITTLVLVAIILIGDVLGGRTPLIVMGADAGAIIACLIFRRWMHQGQVRLASAALIGMDLVGTTVFIALLGTIRTPTTAFYLLIVVGGGLLFDVGGIVVTTAASSSAILGLIVAQNAGWLPQPDSAVTITQWISYTALFGFSGGLTFVALQSTRQALKRADTELAERTRAEAALRDSEARYRRLVEGSPDIVYIFSNRRGGLYYSSSTESVLGYSPEHLCAHPFLWNESIHPDDLAHVTRAIQEFAAGQAFDIEYRIRDARGQWHWLRDRSIGRRLDNGEALIEGLATDITVRKQLEEVLRENEERLRTLGDNLPEAALYRYAHDAQGRPHFEYVSAGIERLMGIAPSDIVGDAAVLLRTILPEDTPRFIQAEAKSRDTLARFEIEVRLRHPRTDEVRWALLRSSPRRRADGSTVWDGVQLDITERRRVEEALRASEEKYRTILESIEDGYYEVDLDGSLTFFNDSLCRLYGYSKDEMMGMNYRQYMNEETAKVVYQTFNTVYQTKKPTKAFDWEVIRKDGSTMFVQLSISLMRAPSGKRVGFRGIVRDITEHRQMEEALRQNRANLQAILDNFPFMVWLKDTEGRFVAVNEPFARSCGRSSPDDVIGGTDLDVWPADLAAGYRADDLEVMRSRQKKSMEERVADQGIEKWVETFKAPLFDLNGNIIGTTGFARDITERKRADEVLRESRANLQTILDNFPFMAWLKDVEGRFVAVNKPFAHACGLNTPDELIGKTDLDVWPPNLAKSYRADDFEVMRLGQKKAVEELVADQGIERWFETFKAPLFDLSGHVTGTTGFARDITERKQMEESLRHANSTLQALFDHSPLSIIMLSVTGNIVLWNQAAESLYGWTVQEVFGKPLPTIPTEKLEEYQALRARVNHGESIPYMEIVRQRKDGSEISLGVSIAPLRDATGNVYAQVSIAADITERKRAENKLQQRTRELDALQATVLDIASPHPLPELLQLIVERASNLLASSSGGLYLCHPERWEVECVVSYNTLRDYTGTVLKYGEGAAGVVAQTGQPLIIKDYRTWNSRAHVYDADQPFSSVLSTPLIWRGNVTGVIHVLRDNEVRPFTDDDLELLMRFANHAAIAVEQARLYNALERELVSRRHAEQALRELNARLEQRVAERTRELTDANVRLTELDRLKDEFIARISHELRTPLTSIKIYLELLEHGRLDKREQYMRTLHDEANKLRRQIDDLLEVSHLQTAGIEPQLAPLDVNHLVQDMIADQLAKAQARGLTLTIAAAADRPDVITDRALVWQVLSRLMANALAYTPRGGAVTLRTDRRAAADQAWVTIEVYDTGPGISEKDLPYIFEPFYRGLAASDYKTPGAGVGLSIAQRTIEQLGGRLTVDSQPGQGTAFTLWLRAG